MLAGTFSRHFGQTLVVVFDRFMWLSNTRPSKTLSYLGGAFSRASVAMDCNGFMTCPGRMRSIGRSPIPFCSPGHVTHGILVSVLVESMTFRAGSFGSIDIPRFGFRRSIRSDRGPTSHSRRRFRRNVGQRFCNSFRIAARCCRSHDTSHPALHGAILLALATTFIGFGPRCSRLWRRLR